MSSYLTYFLKHFGCISADEEARSKACIMNHFDGLLACRRDKLSEGFRFDLRGHRINNSNNFTSDITVDSCRFCSHPPCKIDDLFGKGFILINIGKDLHSPEM